MTRINLIDPQHLTTRHLVAEYKEITQFLHLVKRRVDINHPMDDLPEEYCLNTGHCKFFYDKGAYIYNRYTILKTEMERRELSVNLDKYQYNLARIREAYSDSLFNDYSPSTRDYGVVISRISQRILEKTHLYPDMGIFFGNTHYYGVTHEPSSNLPRDTSLIS